LNTETGSYDEDPSVFAEQFCECSFDEKLQKINIGSSNAATTLSSTVLKQQKEVCDEQIPTAKEELNNITSDVVNNSDVISRSKSLDLLDPINAKSILAKGSRSLPRIFYLTSNPSLDDQDGDLYKYVCIHIVT